MDFMVHAELHVSKTSHVNQCVDGQRENPSGDSCGAGVKVNKQEQCHVVSGCQGALFVTPVRQRVLFAAGPCNKVLHRLLSVCIIALPRS